MKLFKTKLGDLYLFSNEIGELCIADSKGKLFFTFFEEDSNRIMKTLKVIKNYEDRQDFYHLSFCHKIHHSKNMWELLIDPKIEFETEDEFSEIYQIGEHYLKFDY
jgi:hypothetical protein